MSWLYFSPDIFRHSRKLQASQSCVYLSRLCCTMEMLSVEKQMVLRIQHTHCRHSCLHFLWTGSGLIPWTEHPVMAEACKDSWQSASFGLAWSERDQFVHSDALCDADQGMVNRNSQNLIAGLNWKFSELKCSVLKMNWTEMLM